MGKDPSLDELWSSAKPSDETFDPTKVTVPAQGARQYLEHAIARGTRLATAVKLRMHGNIKLHGWYPFEAEEVIQWHRGFIWCATVKMHWLSICGRDCFVHGLGEMRWKLFGVVPLVNASGPDVTHSAAGRMNVECIWLPSVLAYRDVSWSDSDPSHPKASFSAHAETSDLTIAIAEKGRLVVSINMPRWGNPGGAPLGYYNFGGIVEEEGTFAGYTIPTHMRVGWHFGTERFETEGEFFRVVIDDAIYL